MSKDHFTRRELARRTHVACRTLQMYTDIGVLYPRGGRTSGRGFPHSYTEKNVVDVRVIIALQKAGLTLGSIRSVLQELRENRDGHTRIWQGTNSLLVYDPNGENRTMIIRGKATDEVFMYGYLTGDSTLVINLDQANRPQGLEG